MTASFLPIRSNPIPYVSPNSSGVPQDASQVIVSTVARHAISNQPSLSSMSDGVYKILPFDHANRAVLFLSAIWRPLPPNEALEHLDKYLDDTNTPPLNVDEFALICSYLRTQAPQVCYSKLRLDRWSSEGERGIASERIIHYFLLSGISSQEPPESLDLSGLRLTSLPRCIGCLLTLKGLNCRDNPLKILPAFICNLLALTKLDCSNTQLTSLPWSIGNLAALEELDCHSNQLQALPISMTKLSSLKRFNCSYTRVPREPQSSGDAIIDGARKFIRDHFNYRNGGSLDVDLGFIIGRLAGHLEELDFSGTPSAEEERIGELVNLKKLVCTHGAITNLPKSIGSLLHLEELDCSENPDLCMVPDEIFNLPSSCRVSLINCGLTPNQKESIFKKSRSGSGVKIHVFSIQEEEQRAQAQSQAEQAPNQIQAQYNNEPDRDADHPIEGAWVDPINGWGSAFEGADY